MSPRRWVWSARFAFTLDDREVEEWIFWRLWQRNLRPYLGLKQGDLLWLRHGTGENARISWAVEATTVIAERYSDLDDLAESLERKLGLDVDSFWDDPYTQDKINSGLVLAVSIDPRFLVDIPWPLGLWMPQEGVKALDQSDAQLRSWGFLAAKGSGSESPEAAKDRVGLVRARETGRTEKVPSRSSRELSAEIAKESRARAARAGEFAKEQRVAKRRAYAAKAEEALRNYCCPRCRGTETVLLGANRRCRSCQNLWLANPRL